MHSLSWKWPLRFTQPSARDLHAFEQDQELPLHFSIAADVSSDPLWHHEVFNRRTSRSYRRRFGRAPRFHRPHRSHDGQHQLRCSITPLDFVTKCPARAVIVLSLRSILGGLKLDHDLASTYSDTRVFPLPLLVLGYLQALVQA